MSWLTGMLQRMVSQQMVSQHAESPYIESERITSGSQGTVWKGTWKETGAPVAIKKIKLSNMRTQATKAQEEFLLQLIYETSALSKLADRCPQYVTPYYDFILDSVADQLIIVTGWAPITIHEWLKTKPSRQERIDVARNTIKAVQCSHSMNVAHRDLKPDNVMVDPMTSEVKLIDFGLACLEESDMCSVSHSNAMPYNYDPAVFHKLAETKEPLSLMEAMKLDLWALGWILYEILTGTPPYQVLQEIDEIASEYEAVLQPLLEHDSNQRNAEDALAGLRSLRGLPPAAEDIFVQPVAAAAGFGDMDSADLESEPEWESSELTDEEML